MSRKTTHRRTNNRASVHVTLPADVAARLRAYAGYHGVEMSTVVAESLRSSLKGFSVRIDAPAGDHKPAGASIRAHTPTEGEGTEDTQAA